MKKLSLLLMMLVFVVLFAFKPINEVKYPDNVAIEIIEILEGEFVKEMANEDLKKDLESKFTLLFDEISTIKANHSEELGYYYVVLGKQGGEQKIELLEVREKDVCNESYPYAGVNASGFWKQGSTWGPPVCPPGCNFYTSASECLGMICSL